MKQIVTDTQAGIPAAISSDVNILTIPQYIIIGDRSFRDDFEITSSEIIAAMKNNGHTLHTASPPLSSYHPIFPRYAGKGDTILIIGPSAVLSGTINSVNTAIREFPNKSLERLMRITINEYPPYENSHLCIMHCKAEPEAIWLSETLSRELSLDKVPICGVSSALIVHVGPGILAVSFFVS